MISNASRPAVVIGTCYRPPDANRSFIADFHEVLHSVTLRYPQSPVILFGDFNFPAINWSNIAETASKNTVESDFLNTCLTFGLTQIVSNPTRHNDKSSNLLDLILTSHSDYASPLTHLPGLSDHSVLHASFQCGIPAPTKTRKTITLYDKGNYTDMNIKLAEFSSSFFTGFLERSVETNWLLFKNKIHELIKTYIPTITVTEKHSSPWFNTTLKRLNNKKKRLYRAARHSNSECAWQKYYTAEKTYLSLASQSKRSFFSTTLPNILRNNSKQFWNIINPKRSQPLALCDEKNKPIPDHEIAEALNHAFSSVFTNEPKSELPEFPYFSHHTMPAITFSSGGIKKCIDSLKLSSSPGIDGINSKVLKNTKYVTSEILCHIFQQSLSSGVVPDDWKVGKVIPVPKKGPSSSCSSYRPISLTSVCSKLMEHVLHSHIATFLTSVNFFHPNQHGFRKGLSCDSQLALFINDISTNLDQNIPVDALFLDFEKAFDKVPHQRLLLKLSRLHLNPLVLDWIRNFLTNRQQFVYANNHPSSKRPVLSGVPQGTVLGPLLFLIYINDLPANLSSHIRLFADDCVIYRPILTSTDNHALQDDLDKVTTWCNMWLMSLNTTKTLLVPFHRRKLHHTPKYVLCNSEISSVESCKYLGLTLSNNLSWSSHITNITNDANRTLGYFRRNLRFVPPSLKILTYITFIRPKLEYACSVWDPHQTSLSNTLEAVQNRAARFIYSDYSYHTSVSQLKLKAGISNLDIRRHVFRLCLYHKFYHSAPSAIIPVHRQSYRLHHEKSVYPPPARTTAHLHSFFVKTARDWNCLSADVVHHSNPHHFKAAIESTFY